MTQTTTQIEERAIDDGTGYYIIPSERLAQIKSQLANLLAQHTHYDGQIMMMRCLVSEMFEMEKIINRYSHNVACKCKW